jgi:hypothetical protein
MAGALCAGAEVPSRMCQVRLCQVRLCVGPIVPRESDG